MVDKYNINANIFKAFCDENRLMILDILKEGESCACMLLEKLDICQSTLSHHMKILVESSIVRGRKEGKWMYYSLNKQGINEAMEILDNISNNININPVTI